MSFEFVVTSEVHEGKSVVEVLELFLRELRSSATKAKNEEGAGCGYIVAVNMTKFIQDLGFSKGDSVRMTGYFQRLGVIRKLSSKTGTTYNWWVSSIRGPELHEELLYAAWRDYEKDMERVKKIGRLEKQLGKRKAQTSKSKPSEPGVTQLLEKLQKEFQKRVKAIYKERDDALAEAAKSAKEAAALQERVAMLEEAQATQPDIDTKAWMDEVFNS